MITRFTHRRRVKMDELYAKTFAELTAIAAAQDIIVQSNISKWELLVQVLRAAYNTGAQLSVEGILQIQPLGFGMIKNSMSDPVHPSNVYIAPSQIAAFGLKEGGRVFASVRPPNQDESYFAVKDLLSA